MINIIKRIMVTAAGVLLLVPALSSAEVVTSIDDTYDYDYIYDDTDYDYSYDDYGYDDYNYAAAGATAALGVGFIIFMIVIGLVGLVATVFQIWMLIDAIRRDFDQKVLWILLMLFFGIVAAIPYYFMIKRKNVTGGGSSSAHQSTAAPMEPKPEDKPQQ